MFDKNKKKIELNDLYEIYNKIKDKSIVEIRYKYKLVENDVLEIEELLAFVKKRKSYDINFDGNFDIFPHQDQKRLVKLLDYFNVYYSIDNEIEKCSNCNIDINIIDIRILEKREIGYGSRSDWKRLLLGNFTSRKFKYFCNKCSKENIDKLSIVIEKKEILKNIKLKIINTEKEIISINGKKDNLEREMDKISKEIDDVMQNIK